MEIKGDKILIREVQVETKSVGGIYLVDMRANDDGEEQQSRVGIVEGLGDGGLHSSGLQRVDPHNICGLGDAVLVSKMGDFRYCIRGVTYFIVGSSSVLAVLNDEERKSLGIR